ncbi:MAG: IS200/IS605 family accessory protein TnpB-related protein [Conexivisphaerales archaeon]
MQRIYIKRNGKVKDIMYKVSKSIVGYTKSRNMDTIVIGHNDGWKQLVNIGKVNNQNFVNLPFNMLIRQIKYKAEELGIAVIVQGESIQAGTVSSIMKA